MCKSSLKRLTALMSVLLILLQPQFTLAQASTPIKKESLLEVVQRNLLSTRELTQRVEQRGVDFRLTSQDEAQLRQAGARPELIDAVRANYRATTVPPPAPAIAPKPATTKTKPAVPKPLVSYEDLLDRSLAAINANQWNVAGGLLQQALQLNPAQPMAYSLLGYTMLYGRGDLFTAEQAMRAALERNGTVCFEVWHAQGSSFKDAIKGSLFISRSGVIFKSNNSADEFNVNDAEIKSAGVNGFLGREYNAFHLEVRLSNGKTRNYNFAPRTSNQLESLLTLNMIRSF